MVFEIREEFVQSHIIDTATALVYIRFCPSIDGYFHWWVQAETVVGYFNLWDHFRSQEGLEKALTCWDFIKAHITDKENGE